ncbi:MAG: hypothetical protein KAG61_00255, partial [Bacteriovoracaceae bacterium]|nr:hypothetical protein [Bacteriovoracaceae bacterium]
LLMSQSNSGRAMVKELSLLSRVFIVAHDFVTLLYNSDFEPQESKNLIKELLSKYHKGEYLKVVHALTSCHQDYSDNIL